MQQSIHANIAEPLQSNSHCLSYDSQEELQFATKEPYPIDSIVHVSTDKPDDEEYSNDNQSYTEEYPFADEGQPYADQPYVAEKVYYLTKNNLILKMMISFILKSIQDIHLLTMVNHIQTSRMLQKI